MILRKMKLLTSTALVVAAFENNTGWKKNADGGLELDGEGNPIFVGDGGKETTFTPGFINHLNGEAAKHRNTAKDLQTKLAKFGDLDPEEARTAVEKMKDVNLDELVNKGEIDEIKRTMREANESQVKELNDQLAAANQRADNLTLSNAFNSSDFLNERLAVPRDFVQSAYRDRFKVENGRAVPYKSDGEPLRNKHGEIASVDEAFEHWIGERADKESLLKTNVGGGTGSQGGGGNRGGGNILKRSDYDALSPADKAAAGQKVAKGELKVVD